MFKIIVRKNYHDSTGEYLPGNFLRDKEGYAFEFATADDAIAHINEHAGESIYNDKVLDWWPEIGDDK